WLRAGEVANVNGDRLSRANELAERRPFDRRAQRLNQCGVRIGNRRSESRLDDRDALVEKLHLETAGSVVEMHAHVSPARPRAVRFRAGACFPADIGCPKRRRSETLRPTRRLRRASDRASPPPRSPPGISAASFPESARCRRLSRAATRARAAR